MFFVIITQKSKLIQSLTLHNVAIPIKSVFKKYQNDYDYKIYKRKTLWYKAKTQQKFAMLMLII